MSRQWDNWLAKQEALDDCNHPHTTDDVTYVTARGKNKMKKTIKRCGACGEAVGTPIEEEVSD